MPSLDDCPQTAPPIPSGAAGLPRNRWLVCVGITGWLQSECPAALRRNAHRAPQAYIFNINKMAMNVHTWIPPCKGTVQVMRMSNVVRSGRCHRGVGGGLAGSIGGSIVASEVGS